MRSLLAVCTFVGFMAALSAQSPEISWETDYAAALKKADAEKKPLFIVFLMDNEPANDQVAANHLHDAELVELSKKFVPLIACAADHAATTTGGGCSKYHGVTCSAHKKIEIDARTAYMNSPRVAAPQFLFIAPDGKNVLLRHVYLLSPGELKKKMRIALGIADPESGKDFLSKLRAETDDLLKRAGDNNAQVRKEAVDTLSSSDDPRVIEFFIKQTAESVDEPKRLEVIEAMGNAKNGKVLAVLEKLLKAKSNQVRIAVAKSLEKLAMPDCAPALLAAIKREDKTMVRGRLVRALVACDSLTPEHRRFIVSMIKSNSQVDKMFALRVSAQLRIDDELRTAVLRAKDDSNGSVRGVAYWVIGEMKIAEARESITKSVGREKSTDVKNLGLAALSRLGGEKYDGPDPLGCLDDLFESAGLGEP